MSSPRAARLPGVSVNTSVQLFKNFLKTFLVFLASLAAQSRDGGRVELRDQADEMIHFCTQVKVAPFVG